MSETPLFVPWYKDWFVWVFVFWCVVMLEFAALAWWAALT